MAWPVIALAAASLFGAGMSARSQSKAAKKAAEDAAKVQWDMFNLTREDYEPYRNVGIDALYKMAGYSKVTEAGSDKRVPIYKQQKVRNPDWHWDDPSSGPQYTTKNVLTGYKTDPTETTRWEKTGEGIDPTGGSGKYLNALEELTFELDPDDEIYKWRKGESEKTMNQFLASRGLYNSSYGANRLLESGRALQAEEVDRQYSQNYLRQYGQQMDLFNMSNRMGGQIYNKYLNLSNLGYGATGATAGAGANTANQLSSVYQNLGQTQGAAQGAFWSGAGAMPTNALVAYGYGKQAELWK